jgi:hypothetical protein
MILIRRHVVWVSIFGKPASPFSVPPAYDMAVAANVNHLDEFISRGFEEDLIFGAPQCFAACIAGIHRSS